MPIKFPERPKPAPVKAIRYQTRVTAFLDLLGFTEYVGRTRRRGDLVGELHRILTRLSELGQNDSGWSRRTTSFSDSIVLSEQIQACNIWDFLALLGRLQRQMLALEMPARGAVTVGRLYHEQGIVFGPALVQAYRLESSRAKVPRVVIDPAMVTAFLEHSDARYLIQKDTDDLFFIDFLSEQISPHRDVYMNPIEGEYDNLFAMMNQYTTNTRVMEKLLWLDSYFRKYVDESYINFRRKHSPDLLPESHRKKR